MKKTISITILLSIISLTFGALIAKANLEVPEEESEIAKTSLISYRTNEFLDALNKNEKITKIEEKKNSITGETFYSVETPSALLKLDSTTNSITSYSIKEVNCAFEKKSNEKVAKEFILNQYEKLGLPKEYDLVYLEEFDDYCWEADFQKKYGDLYNMYEAVKVFFVPETEEIITLSKFNTEYKETKENTIEKNKAIEIAKSALNDNSKIAEVKLTLIKGNSYFKENSDKSVHKAYVIKTTDENYVFVDAFSGEIIGGDSINE